MAIKAQFNSSTLKASYTVVTSKVQTMNPVGDNCTYCSAGQTPKYIDIILSNPVVCSGCYSCGGDGYDFSGFSGIDGTYRLVQDGANACKWTYNGTGTFGTVVKYNATDCSGSPLYTSNFTKFRITIEKVSNTESNINIRLLTESEADSVFGISNNAWNVDSDCITINQVTETKSCIGLSCNLFWGNFTFEVVEVT